MTCILFWFGCYYNVPNEICDIPFTDQYSKKNAALSIGPLHRAPVNGRHLYVGKPSIIFGGYQGEKARLAGLPPCDQVAHKDIGSAVIDGNEHTVSTNPHLAGHAKPGSLIFPLGDYRDIFLSTGGNNKINKRIFKGEAQWFQGDVTHGGSTFAPDEPINWHISLHVPVESYHHPHDPEDFEIDVEMVAIDQPQLISRLLVNAQIDGITPLRDKLTEAFAHAMTGKSKKVEKEIRATIDQLKSLLIADTNDDQKRGANDSPAPKKVKVTKIDNDLSVWTPPGSKKTSHSSVLALNTAHNSSAHAVQWLNYVIGLLTNVDADGSCGWHVLLILLIHWGLLNAGTTMKELRKLVHDHGMANVELFVGQEEMGEDTVFKTSNGRIGYTYGQRASRNPIKVRTQVFKNTIMDGIYSERVKYGKFLHNRKHWMDASKVLPIAVHRFKPKEPLVLYSSQQYKGPNPGTDGKRFFMTDVYTYNHDSGNVIFDRYEDELRKVPNTTKCMFFDKECVHYQAVTVTNTLKSEDGAEAGL